MSSTRALVLAIAALVGSVLWIVVHRPVTHAAGVIAPDIPLQQPVDGTPPSLHKKDIAITPLATFSITARVLSRADYRWDTAAAISPTDLALGWGRMSDTAVLDKIDISQSVRFYFWRVREFPIPQNEIIESSANMHLIPADDTVAREIDHVKQGDVVTFDGYLIEAHWPNGGIWRSSLTRTDTGAGACEVVWVERFSIAPR
ncbi:MAG TPA: hypothetical protein VH082_08330 [Rudaea sp.]|jgi:hypothetical protein|nr:hypothetical protein [Rudaea sp.]